MSILSNWVETFGNATFQAAAAEGAAEYPEKAKYFPNCKASSRRTCDSRRQREMRHKNQVMRVPENYSVN